MSAFATIAQESADGQNTDAGVAVPEEETATAALKSIPPLVIMPTAAIIPITPVIIRVNIVKIHPSLNYKIDWSPDKVYGVLPIFLLL